MSRVGRSTKHALDKTREILFVQGKAAIAASAGLNGGKVGRHGIVEENLGRDMIARVGLAATEDALVNQATVYRQMTRIQVSP